MNIRAWLDGLSDRERSLVYAAGGIAIIALAYLLLVLPLQSLTARGVARVEKKTADLVWMRQVAPLVTAAASSGASAAHTGESLVVLVDRTAREAGLGAAIRDQTPSSNAGVRLRLEAAPFDTLITWLGQLQQSHGVSIDAANVDATSSPGLVNASLTLSQAAAAG